jgi:ABC-2 type transport system permease protein
MPLHDVGYRDWNEQRSIELGRWWVLALTGVQLVWRGTMLKRTLVLTWLPAVMAALAFFAYEQSIAYPDLRRAVASVMHLSGAPAELGEQILEDPLIARHTVWSTLLLAFFRYPQAFVMLLVMGMIAPRLISYDIRTRGYLLLFSRPIMPWEYVLGKSLVLWFYLAAITTLPALLLYLTGLLLSPDLWVFQQTWDLPLRILAASFVLIVPTSALALAYSSLTVESRYAAFAWFATWVLGWATYSLLTFVEMQAEAEKNGLHPLERYQSNWDFLSPYHVLGKVQQWCFGLTPEDQVVWPYLLILASIGVVSLIVVHRRVISVSQL